LLLTGDGGGRALRQEQRENSLNELQQARERLTLAQEVGGVGLWEWDPATGKTWWSDYLYTLLGRDPGSAEATFETFFAHIHPDDVAMMRTEMAAVVSEKRAFSREFRILRPDGQQRWMLGQGRPERDDAGEMTRVAGINVDITARKEAELALNGVAHDFNNLLGPIMNALEILELRLPEDEDTSGLIKGAMHAALTARALLLSLLASARKQPRPPEPTAISGLIESVSDLIRHSLPDIIALDIGSVQSDAIILVDSNQLELALLNLAINARDAMPDGGTLRLDAIEMAAKPASVGYLEIRVADTGCGMDAATAAQASEPFFTTKAPGKGTGLGLSMAAELVSQSGGEMRIETAPDEGTTIILCFPLHTAGIALPASDELSDGADNWD
jgi:signal transduction histidine kinase